MTRRVAITGIAGLTAFGSDAEQIFTRFKQGENAVVHMSEWDDINDLNTRLAAPITDFSRPKHYSRKQVRSMGRVSLMSTYVTELALQQAGLLDNPDIKNGSMGISYGSSSGSTKPIKSFGNLLKNHSMQGLTATSYVEMMSHTAPVNVGVFFGLKGRVITTSSACTSGSQGIGYAYEAIKAGKQTYMVAGGAEELCVTQAAVFDTLFATSTRNDDPKHTPRPFDKNRDGLVIGEGACSFILEDYDHALARGATILAELVGFGTNSDGQHITQPASETMQVAMELALKDANLKPEQIGYVNAHGTATDRGDVAESQATSRLFGNQMSISSLKSYFGHTLGACGALEAWLSIEMMKKDWFAATCNLTEIDPDCGDLQYIQQPSGLNKQTEYVMSNNFAFGGINTSLIFKRV